MFPGPTKSIRGRGRGEKGGLQSHGIVQLPPVSILDKSATWDFKLKNQVPISQQVSIKTTGKIRPGTGSR